MVGTYKSQKPTHLLGEVVVEEASQGVEAVVMEAVAVVIVVEVEEVMVVVEVIVVEVST